MENVWDFYVKKCLVNSDEFTMQQRNGDMRNVNPYSNDLLPNVLFPASYISENMIMVWQREKVFSIEFQCVGVSLTGPCSPL